MSAASQANASSCAPELIDLPTPVASGSPAPAHPGPPVSPAERISQYSPDEWEVFIAEWATGKAVLYSQIKKFGGSGDRGVDVAGFKTDQGF